MWPYDYSGSKDAIKGARYGNKMHIYLMKPITVFENCMIKDFLIGLGKMLVILN